MDDTRVERFLPALDDGAIPLLPLVAECDREYTCMYCGRSFAELAFYGVCARCYCGNAEARKAADESTPQTIREAA